MTVPRILAFAYACEPGEGSEPGAGWTWARLLARFGETWVITRANNREQIERALPTVPEASQLHFAYVDLPTWARSWKRGGRGIHLYSVLWQMAALPTARRLHRQDSFDVVWHLTLANAWLGSTAPLVGAPFVFGPVGGGVSVPWRLLPALGVLGTVSEVLRTIVRGLARYLNPLARLAWRRASLILVQNPETRAWLPARHRSKAEVLPNVILDGVEAAGTGGEGQKNRIALLAGRLLPWKGGVLALKTIAQLPDWTLMIAGAGPDESRLRKLTKGLELEDRVRFLGRIPRERLLQMMGEEAGVLLFPSLREEAGWVVAEAVASGLPVVCLDQGGPPLLGGRSVLPTSISGVAEELARAIGHGQGESRIHRFDMNARQVRLTKLLISRGVVLAGCEPAPAPVSSVPSSA